MRCEQNSTYSDYHYSSLLASTFQTTSSGNYQSVSCLCNTSVVTPNLTGHIQLASQSFYQPIICTMIITRCSFLERAGVKSGLWTLDWTVDWTMDWTMDPTVD